MSDPLLGLDGLTKAYSGVLANDAVSFDVAAGEVHALLGENGAGKSTLVKMIYGLTQPDAGRMTLSGAPYAPAGPAAARAHGVAMVFQHFSLFDALDVAENISLGMADPPPRRDLARRIREVSHAYGLPLAPFRLVGTLSAGERQRVEIVRCLLQNPRLLIMDEPTSVLTPQEVETLFRTLRQLRDEGRAILYISHKLDEIRALCDRATILRRGARVATCVPAETSTREMAEMMVGSRVSMPEARPRRPGATLLEIADLDMAAPDAFSTPLRAVSLSLSAGEILGIGGVAGNGQSALLSAISGERRASGRIRLEGRDIGALGPEARRRAGLLTAPEERLGHAAAPEMSLTEAALVTARTRRGLVAPSGLLRWRRARAYAEEVIARFDVRTPGPETPARALSGGNLQKFVIGREVLQDPRVLVVNQPTWGVDAAAAAAIRQALIDLAAGGAGVIVISQDLDELLQIAHRFAALTAGRLSAARDMAGLGLEEIGLMMGGADAPEEAVPA